MEKNIWIGTLFVLLGLSAWMDARRKQVSVVLLGIFSVLGIIGYIIWRPVSVVSLLGGIGIGIFVIAISKLTKGEIGLGDGCLLCVTGIYLGFYQNISLLIVALFLSAAWGSFLMLGKKADRKTQIPFVPFLAIAYLGMWICGGGI